MTVKRIFLTGDITKEQLKEFEEDIQKGFVNIRKKELMKE